MLQLLGNEPVKKERDAFDRTPLHLAALTGNRLLYNLLAEYGMKTRMQDDYGWTPRKLLSYGLIRKR